jgi:hypothetical protein
MLNVLKQRRNILSPCTNKLKSLSSSHYLNLSFSKLEKSFTGFNFKTFATENPIYSHEFKSRSSGRF